MVSTTMSGFGDEAAELLKIEDQLTNRSGNVG